METAPKITIEVPAELLERAPRAKLLAASHAYARLRQLRGKVRFTRTSAELKADR